MITFSSSASIPFTLLIIRIGRLMFLFEHDTTVMGASLCMLAYAHHPYLHRRHSILTSHSQVKGKLKE
jgi:hypothetical protein